VIYLGHQHSLGKARRTTTYVVRM